MTATRLPHLRPLALPPLPSVTTTARSRTTRTPSQPSAAAAATAATPCCCATRAAATSGWRSPPSPPPSRSSPALSSMAAAARRRRWRRCPRRPTGGAALGVQRAVGCAPRRATVTVALAQRERAAARQQPLTLIVAPDGGATRAWRCDAGHRTRAGGELGVAQREVHASFVAAAGQGTPSCRACAARRRRRRRSLLRACATRRRAWSRRRCRCAALRSTACGAATAAAARGPVAARVVGEQPAGGGLLRGTACHRAGAARAEGRAHCGALRLQRGAPSGCGRPPRRRARRP